MNNNAPKMVIQKGFLPESKRLALRDHAVSLYRQGQLRSNLASPDRYYRKIYDTPLANASVKDVEKKIRARLKGVDFKVDPVLGWVVSLIAPGGNIQMHYDNNEHYIDSGRMHLRCNVVVSKLPDSGNPIIEKTTYPLEQGDIWVFFAHNSEHGCEKVKGNRPRIIYQFGYSVADITLEDLKKRFSG